MYFNMYVNISIQMRCLYHIVSELQFVENLQPENRLTIMNHRERNIVTIV